jgi:hypothetical protein
MNANRKQRSKLPKSQFIKEEEKVEQDISDKSFSSAGKFVPNIRNFGSHILNSERNPAKKFSDIKRNEQRQKQEEEEEKG